MIIREATKKDLLPAMLCVEEYARDGGFPFHMESATVSGMRMLENENCMIYIAEDQRGIIGIIGFTIVPVITDMGYLKGVEWIWHSDPKLSAISRGKVMLLLLDKMEAWCKSKGVNDISICVKPTNSVAECLKRRGYKYSELFMVMEI